MLEVPVEIEKEVLVPVEIPTEIFIEVEKIVCQHEVIVEVPK